MEILNSKQRRHWRQVFEKEFKEERDKAFQLGVKGNSREVEGYRDEVERLKNKLDWYHRQVKDLEDENDNLQREVRRLRDDMRYTEPSQHTSFSRGGARTGQAGHTSHDKITARSPRRQSLTRRMSPVRISPRSERLIDRIGSPKPAQRTDLPPVQGEEKAQPSVPEEAMETDEAIVEPEAQPPAQDRPIDPTPRSPSVHSDASSNVREKGTGKKLKPMFETDEENWSEQGSTDPEYLSSSDERAVPGKAIKTIGFPAPYRLDRMPGKCKNRYGHVCVDKDSRWEIDSSTLYEKWERSNKEWVWLTGFPMQLAKEAARVPFDQRSHTQRWVVLEATRTGFLPLEDARAEPDVKLIAESEGFPSAVWHDKDGRYNVKAITAWLLFKMAEPEEKEVIKWFWWESAQIFSRWGTYSETLRDMGLKEGSDYIPVRFLIKGEPSQRDLVNHFVHCGVRISDANSHLRDFANAYIKANEVPMTPDWSKIPRSRPHQSRPSITHRRKFGVKSTQSDTPIREPPVASSSRKVTNTVRTERNNDTTNA